ncbi:FAR1 DNA-binding domain [Sesbania bispinosa]|nr:FAR1 DNA-binding domain [Sesbania bispinosa]
MTSFPVDVEDTHMPQSSPYSSLTPDFGLINNDELGLHGTEDVPMPQSSEINEWVPNCDEKVKPKLGKIFDTLEDGEEFYKRYAHSVGFSVHCSSESKNKDGVKRWKYFVCSKEGYKPNKAENVEQSKSTAKARRRSLTRE